MKHKNAAIFLIFFFILVLMLLCFAAGIIWGLNNIESEAEITSRVFREYGFLDGTALKGMMNEAKHSPGLANDYAAQYPMYAYLFDGSFVTYVDD